MLHYSVTTGVIIIELDSATVKNNTSYNTNNKMPAKSNITCFYNSKQIHSTFNL